MKKLLWIGMLFSTLAVAETQVPGLPPGYVPSTEEEVVRYERARVHTELGSQYLSVGNIGVALDEFNTAHASEKRYVPALYHLGLVYMELKEDAKAEDYFKRAIDLDGSNAEAHNNYGWFLCQRDRIDESLKEFMSALKNPLYPTPDKPYVNAGICSLKRKDDKGAEEYFLKALRLRPNQPQAQYYLADIYFRGDDLPSARAQLSSYMKTNPPTAEALWLGVRTERKLGDRQSEASYGQMLRQRFPQSREAQALAAGKYE
jgi:type IV pilus assembly protein PilF